TVRIQMQETCEGVAQRDGILGRYHPPRATNNGGGIADISYDAWTTTSHSLGHHIGKAFAIRRRTRDIECAVHCRHVVTAAGPNQPIIEPQGSRLMAQLV